MLRLKEDHVYTCGDPIVAEDVEDPGMVVREAINCTTEVETSYFSTSLNHYLPPVCVHCGSVDSLLDDTDPYISGNILLLDPYARFVKIMAKMQEHGGKISAQEVQKINC